MAGKCIASSDLFDVSAGLAAELEALMGFKVPVQLLPDRKSLFDVISKRSRTSKKRITLDISTTREGFGDKVISDIGFLRSSSNIADGLKKPMQQRSVQNVFTSHLRTSRISTLV